MTHALAIYLAYGAALFSLALGALGLIAPSRALTLIGLQLEPGLAHSISETRATYGGVFIGASLVPLATGEPYAFLTLAGCWLAAGIARSLSVVVDSAATQFNFVSIAVELGVGTLLALPYLGALAL